MRGEKGKRRRKEGRKYYIYIIEVLRLAGYIDVTFLRRPRSHFFFFFFSFLYDTLFPGNSVTNVRPFCDEIAFDGGVRGRSSEEEA